MSLAAVTPKCLATSQTETPRIVIWEVTQACGLACVHCRAKAQPERHPLELSTQEGFELIDQIAAFPKSLFILTGGDPLERPDIETLVSYAASKGLITALSPSATQRVTHERLVALKKAGIHRVALSLDGADAYTHDTFRGVNGTFENAFRIIQDLRSLGIQLQIGTTISRWNVHQWDQLEKMVEELAPALWSVFFLVPTGRASTEQLISAAECEDVLQRLYAFSRRVRFPVKTTEAPHYRRIILQQSTDQRRPSVSTVNDAKGFVFISHTGHVYPSGFFPISAGNIRSMPLLQLYQDAPLFQMLRDADRLEGKCQRCEYRQVCGGSRARAFALTQNPFSEDPLCAYIPTNQNN